MKYFIAFITLIVVGLAVVTPAQAATPTRRTRPVVRATPTPSPIATATPSAEIATPSATPLPPKPQNLTDNTGEVIGRLERYLLEQPMGPLGPTNFVRYSMRYAIQKGVAANTLVLLLLFPLVAMIVAAARHIIGLRGFGIYIPAVLSIAFVATGFLAGITLFVVILAIATYGQKLIRRLHLQYLPRMALLLWLVALGVFATILIASLFNARELLTVNIFPILILILLAENFNEVQMGKSREEATELTIETLILALISALVMSLEIVQRFALLHPEILLIVVAGLDILIGKYVGLRFTEYMKFKKLLES